MYGHTHTHTSTHQHVPTLIRTRPDSHTHTSLARTDDGQALRWLVILRYSISLSNFGHKDACSPISCDRGSGGPARLAPRTGKQTNSWQPRMKEQMDRSGLSKFGDHPRSGRPQARLPTRWAPPDGPHPTVVAHAASEGRARDVSRPSSAPHRGRGALY